MSHLRSRSLVCVRVSAKATRPTSGNPDSVPSPMHPNTQCKGEGGHATKRQAQSALFCSPDAKECDMTVLKRGSSGPEVTALQQALLAHGFDPGIADGAFGGGTEAAVIAFQNSEGMLADGVAGPRTLAALQLADSDALP